MGLPSIFSLVTSYTVGKTTNTEVKLSNQAIKTSVGSLLVDGLSLFLINKKNF